MKLINEAQREPKNEKLKDKFHLNVLVIEDNSDVQRLIALNLKRFDCNVVLRNFSDTFFLEELQNYQIILISVLPDRDGIRLLMKIHKKMNECRMRLKAKFVAYTACGKAMVGMCRNCGFDEVLEVPAMLKDYQALFRQFYSD